MLNDFLSLIGVKAGVILAGFGGAVTRIAVFGTGGASVLNAVISVIGGTITAIYLGPVAPAYLGWDDSARSSAALTFLVGLFGMEICKQIGMAIGHWMPSFNNNSSKEP